MARARAAPGGLRGEALEWRERAPRTDAACRHFGVCGGCRLQHLAPEEYAAWIASKVERALRRHALAGTPIRPAEITPPGSRRRIRLGFIRSGRRIRLGFRALASHRIVEITECPVARPAIVALLEPLRVALEGFPADQGEVLIAETDGGLDVLLITQTAPDLAARERLAGFAEACDLARLAWTLPEGSPEALVARREVAVGFDRVRVPLPIGAFLQASTEAESMIRHAVVEALGPSDPLADIYAGCGTFALPLAAEGRHVLAADAEPAMIEALGSSARGAGFGDRVTTLVRDLERRPLGPDELRGIHGAVLDPPRAGALAQVKALVGTGIRRLAMVSCNPATFARDARALTEAGFELDWVQPIDPFLWSAEVELVGAFRRAPASCRSS